MNLYEILELTPSASINDIKSNYKRLAKKYHPDKNKSEEAVKKFQDISTAYEILSNDKSRKEYLMLNVDSQNMFQVFLSNIFNNTLKSEHLSRFGINITKKDYEYLKTNFYDVINSLDLTEIINFFKSGEFPIKNYEFNNLCSDTDITNWDDDDATYVSRLPLELQKHNNQTLRISRDITLDKLINNTKESLTIKRKVDNDFVNTEFNFIYKNQWIVFSGGGDCDAETVGDLIIKVNLPENYDWQDNLIIYQKNISLYEYVYGTNVSFKIGNSKIEYNNWVPSREGNIIFLDKIENCKYDFAIKFILNYQDNEIKRKVLKEYFN